MGEGLRVRCGLRHLHRSEEALVVHRNAPLTETGRLRLARCVVDDGWPVRRAAERFRVSHTTAFRWAIRYRTLGVAGMSDGQAGHTASPPGRLPPWRNMCCGCGASTGSGRCGRLPAAASRPRPPTAS
ncbi:leucine zipper domain-containing protein [Streptomyces xanthophaeus]|uniref:leucine zipper domain-containing protein n=1 Tax=Streptomyces xanthophaeus TaxID=67385 RepID=UPI00399021B9